MAGTAAHARTLAADIGFRQLARARPADRPGAAARASRRDEADDHRRLQPQPPVARARAAALPPPRSTHRTARAARRTRARSPGVAAGPPQIATSPPICRDQVLAAGSSDRVPRDPSAQSCKWFSTCSAAHSASDGAQVSRRLAMQVQHVPPDRHRGIAAVVAAARPSSRSAASWRRGGRRPAARGNAARHAGLRAGSRAGASRSAPPSSRRPSRTSSIDIQARDLVLGRQRRAVGDVVGVAREGVERVHVRAQTRRDQRRADREILVAAVLARPCLHRSRTALIRPP